MDRNLLLSYGTHYNLVDYRIRRLKSIQVKYPNLNVLPQIISEENWPDSVSEMDQ